MTSALLVLLVLFEAGCAGGFISGGFGNNAGGGSGGGQITVPPPVVKVTVTPATASVAPGGQLQLSALVQNTTNTSVTWAVNGVPGGNLTVGTITSNGAYQAPSIAPTPNTVTITATSTVNTSAQGTAIVVISAPPSTVTVSVTPAAATIQTNASMTFSALVTGTTNTAVTWTVNGIAGGNATLGTITTAGVYTAPAAVPSPATISVTATSAADPTASSSSAVTIQQRVQVSVTPGTASVLTGASQQFTATVTGTAVTTVTWAVNGVAGGNSTEGTIDNAGLYTGPAAVPTPNAVTISATSTVDPTASGVAVVNIVLSPGVTVSVAPATATVSVNQTRQFTATVGGLFKGLPPSSQVTWFVNNVPGGDNINGTISNSGLYTAPANVPFPNTVIIKAYSVTDPSASGSAVATITAPALVTVSVAPATASVQIGNTQQFTATVTGTTNTAVTWTVNGIAGGNSVVGTVSATGLYTAPASVPSPPTVAVTATSSASPSSSGTASVTVLATPVPISVSVSPAMATLVLQQQLQFNATVTGTANQNVTWSLSGAGCSGTACGTISATGVYVAPKNLPSPATVTVTATSQQDPTKSGTASVTLTPPATITISPTTTTVQTGLAVQFFVAVTGVSPTTVTYAVNGTVGGNSSVGTINSNGLYVAPAAVPATNPVSVTATSVANNTLVATATVTIAAPVSVAVAPPSATLTLSQQQQFTATVTGTTNTAVTWHVNGILNGNATVGTIDNTGLYTAPASALLTQTYTISATSVANPTQSGTAQVTVTVPVGVSISPTSASLQVSRTQQFSATVTGTANTAVTWSVTGTGCSGAACGTISSSGLYTAPAAVPSPATVTVTATSVADPTKFASATVTLTAPAISVSVNPTTANVSVNGSVQFSATVANSSNQSVTWTVAGTGCSGATCGTVSATGLYTAPGVPPSPANVSVTATSVADPTKSASASVTITSAVAVTISPTSASVLTNGTQQFTATVTGSGNTAVTWSVAGAGCSGAACGTVSGTGLYTAPAAAPSPASVSVTATSVADPTKSASATVTIAAPISVSIAPTAVSLVTSQTQQFTATVTGTSNTAVTWSVDGIAGGNSSSGTISVTGFYVAPTLVPTPNTITVTATSVADPTKSASATVTITSPPVGVFVSVFPRNRNLPIGLTQQFTAEVFRTNNNAVTWTIGGAGCGGAGSPCGTISAAGLYTPPAAPPTPAGITITATSQVDPTASMTVNATVVVGVAVAPASLKIVPKATQQFTATVVGSSNTSVTWAVDGITGGNAGIGTISTTGLYTAPNQAPAIGIVTINATSAADPTVPGVATANILPAVVTLSPAAPQVLPGGSILFIASTGIMPPPTSTLPILTWTVNGIPGGNSTVGTINASGVYTAPTTIPSPATVTVAATSTITPSATASATVTIGPAAGASPVTLLPTLQKVRPYDIVTNSTSTLSVNVAGNQYASWQVLLEGRGEDLTGVDVTVSDFTDTNGNRITAAGNAVVYLEKYINLPYVSRAQSVAGEWPDPLIPRVDPFVSQTRNAFPFGVNRISPAYKIYPRVGGDTVNTGMGDGSAVSGGTSTATQFRQFVIVIDKGGAIGGATFKWSNDGGATFPQTNVPIPNNSPIPLSDGVTIAFQPGNVTGVQDFNVGDTYWIFAGPHRQQPVWIDFFVPGNTPVSSYTGTVTVVRAGKTNVTLTVTLSVVNHVLPISSSIPSYFGMNWTSLVNGHFLIASGSQALTLGQLYGEACLINRISCDAVSTYQPNFTFNVDGSIATSDYSSFNQAVSPLMNGTITPHGEQLTLLRLPHLGNTRSEQYFATQHMLNTFVSSGWRPRVFDFSYDEPVTASDFAAAMDRTSIVRSVDPMLLTSVTSDISKNNFNMIGYTNAWTPNWTTLDNKEFISGPNPSSRSFYNAPVANGDLLWWYESCMTHGCGTTGITPQNDNWPNFNIDTPALFNRDWGLAAASPYGVTGMLEQNTVLAYSRFYQMGAPGVDVWNSVYYLGGNGDGTLFYPGRTSIIGGTTDIPIESLRLKYIRDAMVDQEISLFLTNRGDGPFTQQTISADVDALYVVLADPTAYTGASRTLLNQTGQAPLPPLVHVPAAGGCYTDPVTGNQVCRVTDRNLCHKGGHHFYSWWPVWNQTGTHMIVECIAWVNGPQTASNPLLVRDSDLGVIGDARAGMPPSVTLKPDRLFWAWTDPNKFFGFGTGASGGQLWEWNPFTKAGGMVKNFRGMNFFSQAIVDMQLAYVSFDDRYFLIEPINATGINFMLLVYDRLTDTVVGTLDLSQFPYYDESVFTKANKVYVRATDTNNIPQAFVYSLDFATRIRPSEGGHHAHGLLPNGKPVTTKASSNRSCPPGSLSGVPGSNWKPTSLVIDDSVDTTGFGQNADPLPSVLLKLGCGYRGQHNFDHWSWNNTQTDRFFNSSLSYSGFGSDVLAFGILRFRLQFDPSFNITGDIVDFLAHHRSQDNLYGYWAKPRTSCNQQGSACTFESTMTVQTDNLDPQEHVYIVRFTP